MKPMFLVAWLVCSLLLFAVQLPAQTEIPSGTIFPVALNTSLNSHKVKAGQKVTARVMQDVSLPAGSTIRAGAKVMGQVIEVHPQTATSGATLSLRFDTLAFGKRRVPIVTDLRALASMMGVYDAQLPESGTDRGTPESAWTTDQIGGEVVYRGGGPVARGLRVVGTPTADGVLVRVAASPGTKCRGAIDGNDRPQALWVFSSDACGAYDFENLAIVHAGRSNPVGEITLASERGDLKVRAGSGMLLRVIDMTAKQKSSAGRFR